MLSSDLLEAINVIHGKLEPGEKVLLRGEGFFCFRKLCYPLLGRCRQD
jgi:hypothetical protein